MAVEVETTGLVDVHTQVFDPVLPDFNCDASGRVPTVARLNGGKVAVFHEGRPYRHLDERSWSPRARLQDMDAEGVAVQVLSPLRSRCAKTWTAPSQSD